MKKKTFIFEFPNAKATINVETSPLCVKDLAIQYLDKQNLVFGTLCLIRDGFSEEILAIACYASADNGKIKFFTEDESINDIVELHVKEGGE